jgi:tripartite-type tricarboxylate transporter receptor subunit TctC
MTFASRRLLATCAAVFGVFVFSHSEARAQGAANWPQKPVTLVVPFAAGGGTDAFARPLASHLENKLGQRFIIENKAGAGGTVGASFAAKQAPDGYTFFIGAAHHAIAPAIYPKLDYNIETDFVPVGLLSSVPQVVVVSPIKLPNVKTLQDLIADAKANPGKLNFASAGHGTTHQLAGELFKLETGTNIAHVPYRGAGPAMQDLVAGHVDMMFDGLGSSSDRITSNQLRALAIASDKRVPAFPNVPTAAEAGLKNYVVSTWYAVWAPKGTPPEIVARMIAEMKAAFETQAMKDTWQRNGSDIPNLYGPAFSPFLAAEVARWGKVVKDANVKIE